METTPEQLAARVARGPLAPAYLVAGAETLRVLEAADAIRAAARAEGIAEREVFAFEGDPRGWDWDPLVATFRAPSLFASRRLVEVRMPGGKPGTEGAKAIAEFCADPAPDVCLLVTCGEWSRAHGGRRALCHGRCFCRRVHGPDCLAPLRLHLSLAAHTVQRGRPRTGPGTPARADEGIDRYRESGGFFRPDLAYKPASRA